MAAAGLKRKLKCPAEIRKRLQIRNWTVQEESAIAQYIVDKPYLGKDQAKETLIKYERRMLDFLKLKDCDVKRLQNKITAMKKKYEEVRKWIAETGQGVQAEDPEGFPDVIIKMCHYYYTLDEILATSQAMNTSYQRHEGLVSEAFQDHASQIEDATQIELMDEIPPGCHSQDVQLVTAYSDSEEFASKTQPPENICTLPPENICTLPPSSSADVNISQKARKQNKFSKYDLPIEKEKNQRVSAVQKLSAIFNSKCEGRVMIEEKKLAFEQLKWEEENKLRTSELEENRKSELEKIKMQCDAELEKIKLQKEADLEKIKLQHDAELEKIKVQNDAELEKIKIQRDVEMQKIQLERDKLQLELKKVQSQNVHLS